MKTYSFPRITSSIKLVKPENKETYLKSQPLDIAHLQVGLEFTTTPLAFINSVVKCYGA